MQKTVEINTLNDRIAAIISHLGISQTAFAKQLSTTTSRITNITQGRNKPDSQLLAAIAETYPQIDTIWLLTGKGSIDRNVNFPSQFTAEDYIKNPVKAQAENPYLNSTQTHIQSSKRRETNNPAPRPIDERWLDYLLKDNKLFPGQAGSDAKQREWERIDTRLRAVVGNLLHIYEVTEDVLGVPFDDEAYNSLRAQSATPRLQRAEDGRYVNPVHEMEYDERNRYYDSRNQLLEHCEAELSEAIRNLNMALSHPDLRLFSSTPRKGSVAELLVSSGFLAKRHKARYGEEPNK